VNQMQLAPWFIMKSEKACGQKRESGRTYTPDRLWLKACTGIRNSATVLFISLAERVGFEPTGPAQLAHTLSRRAP
jgi:hypothetical protein